MQNKIILGLKLRCPHCGQGHLNKNFFSNREICEVCSVRFERKSGEAAGASIIWVSILPLLALPVYIILYSSIPDLSLPAQLAITMSFIAIIGVLGYRHIRGAWIGFVEMTEGLKTDAEVAEKSTSASSK